MKSLLTRLFTIFFMLFASTVYAQTINHQWQPQPITLMGNSNEFGDCDLWGRGRWNASFYITVQNRSLRMDGTIQFVEPQHDYTKITGKYTQTFDLGTIVPNFEKAIAKSVDIFVSETSGSAGGQNKGNSGSHMFPGSGFVNSAEVVTDTKDCDTGEVGGTFFFNPITIVITPN